jgi:hypothetical protein
MFLLPAYDPTAIAIRSAEVIRVEAVFAFRGSHSACRSNLPRTHGSPPAPPGSLPLIQCFERPARYGNVLRELTLRGNEINEKNELRGTERGDLIRLIRPLAESGERTERLADEQAAAPRAARHTIEQEGVQCR